jgi:uncharacterized protein (DUF2344 family)|tara:strand:- start:417 stop:932 length:516 start_codon:yes stop_codon:yes gene_type:complete
MKKIFFLFSIIFLLNGCVESVALLGSSVGGASSGRLVQSSLQSTISYGIKKQTGKTPLGHALAYAEVHNPEKKKETCISFIEKTRSEFCTIAKKKISLTNSAIKEKVASTVKIKPKTKNSIATDTVIEHKTNVVKKDKNSINSFNRLKKSPRELAAVFQAELKKIKDKYVK